MAKTLRQNLTSSYVDAANRLSSKKGRRRIVAYVESYDDVAFWRSLLSEFEDDTRYFQVMLPSSTSLSKGKKMVLMNTLNTQELGRSLIACVDSDYDFLLQGATATSHKINSNPYILQTYGYAIESYRCYAPSLHEVCVQATLNDRPMLDFAAFMRRYSETVYPLFLWNVWFYRRHDTDTFPMHDLHSLTRLQDFDPKQPDRCLRDLKRSVDRKLTSLRRRFAKHVESVQQLGRDLERLGLKPETTYLYMQGHHIMDSVVLHLLTPICASLRREREEEIKKNAIHDQQRQNELSSYENSQTNVQNILRRNEGYRDLYLYQWMREDVRDLLATNAENNP